MRLLLRLLSRLRLSPRFEYDVVIDRPSRPSTSDPCGRLLSAGGGSRFGQVRAAVCNFPFREMKRDLATADINVGLAEETRPDGRGGNLPFMVNDRPELVYPSLAWWRNPPNTGEDLAMEEDFETYTSVTKQKHEHDWRRKNTQESCLCFLALKKGGSRRGSLKT